MPDKEKRPLFIAPDGVRVGVSPLKPNEIWIAMGTHPDLGFAPDIELAIALEVGEARHLARSLLSAADAAERRPDRPN